MRLPAPADQSGRAARRRDGRARPAQPAQAARPAVDDATGLLRGGEHDQEGDHRAALRRQGRAGQRRPPAGAARDRADCRP